MNDQEDFLCFMRECGLTPDELEEAKHRVAVDSHPQEGMCIKSSPIDGLGVFATRDFEPGEIIGSLTWDGAWTQLGRYGNHSANPTARVQGCFGTLFCDTQSPIPEGTEITFNYRKIKHMLVKLNTEAQRNTCVNT